MQLPPNSKITKSGSYLRIIGAKGHPIASQSGTIPYNRFVLFQKLNQPSHSACHWCDHVLPWKSSEPNASRHVICANTIDHNPENSNPDNLVPSCFWCASNRSWAEDHPMFWENWRRWLKNVPPHFRPNLIFIAEECGIIVHVSTDDDYYDGVD